MRGWLLPALVAFGVAVALAGATFATAGRNDGKHDRGAREAKKAATETSSTQSSASSNDQQSGSEVCGLDEVWLQTSIEGDRFEIDGGQIALSKPGTTPQVRELAQTLIKDHSKSLEDAIELANKYGIEVPTEPSPSMQWQLEEIREMSGAEFNHDYSELEVADHVQDIQEAKDEVELGCNEEIRDDAKDEIPVLEYHLQLAQEALKSAHAESDSRKS
jgi:putative membrane protein